jgi:hypothetical protein
VFGTQSAGVVLIRPGKARDFPGKQPTPYAILSAHPTAENCRFEKIVNNDSILIADGSQLVAVPAHLVFRTRISEEKANIPPDVHCAVVDAPHTK